MQVEVNEHTIVKYNLVELTGNSAEDLLRIAREARETGHVLTVTVPDDVPVNIFDAAHGQITPEERLRDRDQVQNPIMDGSKFRASTDAGRKIEVTVEGVIELPDDDVVDGEIMEDED